MIIFYFLQDINSIKFRINLYRTIRPLRIQFDQTKLIRLIFFLIQLKIQFKPDSKSWIFLDHPVESQDRFNYL